MRHGHGYRKLNRTHEHRKAMFANMVSSLIEHEQIKTTLPKAKELKRIADKIITLGKRGDLNSRRIASAEIRHEPAVKKLFDTIVPMMEGRPCGYTRITKLGRRPSDSSEMCVLEWVAEKYAPKTDEPVPPEAAPAQA